MLCSWKHNYFKTLVLLLIVLCTTGPGFMQVMFERTTMPIQSHPVMPMRSLSHVLVPQAQAETNDKYFAQVQELQIGSKKVLPTPTVVFHSSTTSDWGVAHQIDAHTWTVELADDDRMATPQEVFTALNNYRQQNGRNTLTWDNGLGNYAQQRANLFASMGQTDKHAGFSDFVNNHDGFKQLGFNGLGENSSYGYKLLGVHIIEWMYAADPDHNSNQLNSDWTSVGIGVSGLATDLVFGGRKI